MWRQMEVSLQRVAENCNAIERHGGEIRHIVDGTGTRSGHILIVYTDVAKEKAARAAAKG